MQTEIDEAKKDAAVFKKPVDNSAAQRERVNTELGKITSLLPGIVDLSIIAYNNQIWTVTGTAPDDSTIVDYVRDLRNSNQFSSVLISDMSEVQYNEWQFNLTLE